MCSQGGCGAGGAEHDSRVGVGTVWSGSKSNQSGICHLHHYLHGPTDPACSPGCNMDFCLAPYPAGHVKRRMVVLLHMQHPCCHVGVETAQEHANKMPGGSSSSEEEEEGADSKAQPGHPKCLCQLQAALRWKGCQDAEMQPESSLSACFWLEGSSAPARAKLRLMATSIPS